MNMTSFSRREDDRSQLAWWSDNECWSGHVPPDLRGVLSGAFNPLHQGHLGLQSIAADLLGGPVAFELAAVNADKPPLCEDEIRRRCLQFDSHHVVVSRAATYLEKCRLFPRVSFVVGADTALRVVEPRFYGGNPRAMDEALQEIAACGCQFLVAARMWEGRLVRLEDLPVPAAHVGLFREIPAALFRLDVSSTDLRHRTRVESPQQNPDHREPC